jgi:hypothetical protein
MPQLTRKRGTPLPRDVIKQELPKRDTRHFTDPQLLMGRGWFNWGAIGKSCIFGQGEETVCHLP